MAIVGIDLGTTTSEVAIFKNNAPKVIPDGRGNEIIDSYFGLDPKTRLPKVGEEVRNVFKSSPDQCVEQVKRKMGQDINIPVGDQKFLPEEISAHILRYLKAAAESYLDDAVDRVVITVPANFPDTARNATIRAGQIAGFHVERIINEPTAAALAYGHSEGMEEEVVLVYDLGGGTFDVTIVEYIGNTLDILSSAGDPHLGGKDFDQALLNHVLSVFTNEHGVEIQRGSGPYYNLLFACEKAKKELSFNQATIIHIPFFTVKDGQPVTLDVEVTRSKFESLIAPMIDRTELAINKALKDAKIKVSAISRVLLVGGSSRIPYVRKLVERVTGISPRMDIDPDRAIAMGAAIQAAIIDGASDQIIMDVCPLSLGTSTLNQLGSGHFIPGAYSEILPPNWKMLKPRTETFYSIVDDQKVVKFRVYQRSGMSQSQFAEIDDEPNTADGFTLLGVKDIPLPPGPAGQEVKTTYTYNLNGVIDVLIEVGAERFTFIAGVSFDENQLAASRARIDGAWKESEYYEQVRALMHAAEKDLEKGMDPAVEEELRDLLDRLKTALAFNDSSLVSEFETKITNLLFDLS
jgi:molecular chaperone DnaK